MSRTTQSEMILSDEVLFVPAICGVRGLRGGGHRSGGHRNSD